MHETTAQDVEPPCFDSVVADEKNQGKIIASRLAYVTLPKTSLTWLTTAIWKIDMTTPPWINATNTA